METANENKYGRSEIYLTRTLRSSCPALVQFAVKLAIASCLMLAVTVHVPAQRSDILEIKAIKNEIRSLFSLSSGDLVRIEPVIDQESRKLIKMYARFGGEEPEYSTRVWNQIIEDRAAFEMNLGVGLSKKQKNAIRSARSQMEQRVLGFLVDEYTSLLIHILDLSSLQANDVVYLFETECEKKRRLIDIRIGDPHSLQKEFENLTEATETSLKRILSADQWREYCKLKEGDALVA